MGKKIKAEERVVEQPKVETPMDRARVYVDGNRRTCLALRITDDACTFIPLDIEGLDVQTWSRKKFEDNYEQLFDYPVLRASRVFIDIAQKHGATKEVMDELRLLTVVTEKEYIMATTKKAAAAAKLAGTKTAAAKPKAVKTEKSTAPKEPSAPRETASGMFQELLVEGKLSDDQIFKKVQAKFGLADDKRGYVNWYRNKLVKDGKLKAPPKAAEKPAPKAAEKKPAAKKKK